jgi:hypothetical protein
MQQNTQSTDTVIFIKQCTLCERYVQTKKDYTYNKKFICSNECQYQAKNNKKQEIKDQINKNVEKNHITSPSKFMCYLPNFIKCIFPSETFMNYICCYRCKKHFYSSETPDYCDACQKYVPKEFNCKKCLNPVIISQNQFIKMKNYCKTCYDETDVQFKCNHCDKLFISNKNKIRKENKGKKICEKCIDLFIIFNFDESNDDHIQRLGFTRNDQINYMKVTYRIQTLSSSYLSIHDDDHIVITLPIIKTYQFYHVHELLHNKDFNNTYDYVYDNDNIITSILDIEFI